VECTPFRDVSSKAYKISNQSELARQSTSPKGFQNIFLVGICKWLLKMGTDQRPQSKMEVKNAMGYKVKPEAEVEDMVSVALKFIPQHGVTQDSIKLASNSAKTLDECQLAASVATAISGLLDVDEYLADCPEIFEEMVTASSDILSAIGYDVTEYRNFAVS